MATTSEYLAKLVEDKNTLKSAFAERGIDVSDDDNFSSLATKSSNLPTGGGGGDLSEYFESSPSNTNSYGYSQLFKIVKKLPPIDISSMQTSPAYMFNSFLGESLKVKSTVPNYKTIHTSMFYNCTNLKTLDLSEYDGSLCTAMDNFCSGNANLESLNLSTFSGDVTTLSYSFRYCSKITNLNVNNLNTTNCLTMAYTFESCSELTSLNLSSFNTRKVANTNATFSNCTKLATLTLGTETGFDKTTNATSMFNGCSSLESLDLSATNNSVLNRAQSMFRNCKKLKYLDISGFDFTTLNSASSSYKQYFFDGCTSLETVLVKDETAKTFVDNRLSVAGLSVRSTIKGA